MSERRIPLVGRALCLGHVMALLVAGEARAIPAFARAYGVSCNTCHSSITRRNEFGDVFRKMGYHWPGDIEVDRQARAPTPTEMRGTSAFTGFWPQVFPFAASLTMGAAYDPDTDPSFTAGEPTVNLLFGGAAADHIRFFGTWSGSGPPNEAHLNFVSLAGRPELNLRVGRFEQTTTLFKQNEALIGSYMLGTSALNGHAVSQGRLGVEAYGAWLGRLFWAAGTVQNAGVGSHFDAYYHMNVKLGGIDYLGGYWDPESKKSLFTLTGGHWGYFGEVSGTTGEAVAVIRRLGVDLKLQLWKASVWGGGMFGIDRDALRDLRARSFTAFSEISFAVTSWLIPMYLYQYQDGESFRHEKEQHDVGVVLLILQNLRARTKFFYRDEGEGTSSRGAEVQLLFAM